MDLNLEFIFENSSWVPGTYAELQETNSSLEFDSESGFDF
jgi:hypothetical protein